VKEGGEKKVLESEQGSDEGPGRGGKGEGGEGAACLLTLFPSPPHSLNLTRDSVRGREDFTHPRFSRIGVG